MRHLPIYRNVDGCRVVVSGGGSAAVAKLRLLFRTKAQIDVFAAHPACAIISWAEEGRITLMQRPLAGGDLDGVVLLYGANEDGAEDLRVADMGRAASVLVSIVDDLENSDFITPAIVDRDPVSVAIGTEGNAPSLARKLKRDIEERLPTNLGMLAEVAHDLRLPVKQLAPWSRRRFWSRFFEEVGPRVLRDNGNAAILGAFRTLFEDVKAHRTSFGHVWLAGAGPGDPELLTLRVRKLLDIADVIVHDRLVSRGVLDLARREATVVEVGKRPGAPSWCQHDISALLIEHANRGAQVLRLKSGDPSMFGRLDEEIEALNQAGISFEVEPGVTAALAAAASAKISLTSRGRNSSVQFITGQDMDGFAEHDWRSLARSGTTVAIYMGVGAAAFIRGRLLMYGAAHFTPVTVVENASTPEQKIVGTSLIELPETLSNAKIDGPVVMLLGVLPRDRVGVLERAVEVFNGESVGSCVL